MNSFNEQLSSALNILETQQREVLVKQIQDLYRSAVSKLKLDGRIVISDDDYNKLRAGHEAVMNYLNKVLASEPNMLKGLSSLNDLLLASWSGTSETNPTHGFVEAINTKLLIAARMAYEEWLTTGQQAIDPVNATYIRRFKQWSGALKDVLKMYDLLAQYYQVQAYPQTSP